MILVISIQTKETGFIAEQQMFHMIPDFEEFKAKVKRRPEADTFSRWMLALRKNLNGELPHATVIGEYIYTAMIFKE